MSNHMNTETDLAEDIAYGLEEIHELAEQIDWVEWSQTFDHSAKNFRKEIARVVHILQTVQKTQSIRKSIRGGK